jgi:hypothetical protein
MVIGEVDEKWMSLVFHLGVNLDPRGVLYMEVFPRGMCMPLFTFRSEQTDEQRVFTPGG